MNCGPSAWDKRSREQMMSECDDCITQPCNPAEDGVCEALECCKHGVDDGACKECYDDTALLRQALEALELSPCSSKYEQDCHVCNTISALRTRLSTGDKLSPTANLTQDS
jgi:hypothetical protein